MRKMFIAVAAAVSVTCVAMATVQKVTDQTFWVYSQPASRLNHFIPSGWMGDFGDVHFNQRWNQKTVKGEQFCIQVKYTAERKQGAGWAGIYWQTPANNWGDKVGGFDLTGFKKLKFKARGETGKEWIDKFMVGGISANGETGDSATADSGGVELPKEWKDFEIPLDGQDMSVVIGGFGFVVAADSAPNGETFYISDVRFER